MEGALERYKKLGLPESLPRFHLYPIATTELSFILRRAYSNLPKVLQNLIFQDTLTAFRLLPGMQGQAANAAANLLIQSAEAALPKQKRVLAVSEFKHAKVALKRRSKVQQEEKGSIQLPQDVLVHIFSFLDLQSLVSAGLVCWLWHSVATDNYIWHLQYVLSFGSYNNCPKVDGLQGGGLVENKESALVEKDFTASASINWREAFKNAYLGNSLRKSTSYRGYCGRCNAIVWLNNMKCSNKYCRLNPNDHKIKPILPEQTVEYILEGTISMASSSDSDSDSEGGLWAYSGSLVGHGLSTRSHSFTFS